MDQSASRDQYEVIVVDDGSTDGTRAIAESFPVHLVPLEWGGRARARNEGARRSRGDVILFLDADCVPVREWIEEITRPLEDPQVVAVKGALRTHQRSLCARFVQMEFEERYALLLRQRYIDFVDTGSAAFRRSVLQEVDGFDTTFPWAEDAELSYRIAELGHKMVFNPRAVVYHPHPDRWTRYLWVKFWRAWWRTNAYRRYPKKAVKDSYTPQVLKLQVGLFGLLGLSLAASLLWSWFLYISAGLAALLLGSTAPFAARGWEKDRQVALVSPMFLLGRTAAFASGVALGLLWGLIRRSHPAAEQPARAFD